ncbi:hypothetical protein QO034_17730 [Sedimentitalea sp. JM2-8]|uniref:Uncharacterized protein n=1 Tax=Sedimentitalea xiamensis TaxID=3050037 RepID=A0ABT7FIH9_9RHOB|nr:hypothetical protein [Sedimentitalea xiamensis]MDK3074933.1 hypothetical protein [Sedimentitalea xiamensis]
MIRFWKNQAFTIAHADDGKFVGAGLRAVFECNGQSGHILREDSCVFQPPGIRHRDCRHSGDIALNEVIPLAGFDTREEPAQ